jgi:hypothetical protein
MFDRREFLRVTGAGLAGAGLGAEALLTDGPALSAEGPDAAPRKKLAVVTTEWRYKSHAWHMAERFLTGYPLRGRWHRPAFEVVSAYVDQRPEGDLSRDRAAEFGFTIYPTIAEALRCGGRELAVDAVLVIGEHGDYATNEIGQKLYPRYEFFCQVAEVYRQGGRAVPLFNDKHLSWNFDYAREMVEVSRELGFAFLAGSSLPVTWRMPAVDVPLDAPVEEALCVAMGRTDIYDFHALETIQCMVERRRGGETGVAAVHALRGDAVWTALDRGSWEAGGWDGRLFQACLSRSHTLAQGESFNHRYPTLEQMRAWVADPIAYRLEYADGMRATMLLLNGLVDDFTFAARIAGQDEPLSTLFHLPPNPNVVYSAALMSKAEETFATGVAPYPVERTLLTSGLVQACLQSLASGQERLETPHLAVRYAPPQESQFARE